MSNSVIRLSLVAKGNCFSLTDGMGSAVVQISTWSNSSSGDF